MSDQPTRKSTPKRRGGRKPILDAELVAAAIVEHSGNISEVAKKFGVHRSSVQQLIGKRLALQKILADARGGMLDDAESALQKAIKKGEAWAVCFTLKTLGKGRGYIERQDSEPTAKNRLVIEEEIVDGGDDQKKGPAALAAS
jgi:hypothetical protein